jgi:hypothetical protein
MIVGLGCSDDLPTTTTTKPPTFPNEVGYLWTYEFLETQIMADSTVIETVDSVQVVVIRDTILANGNRAKKWVYRYQNKPIPDTQLVVTVGDSVKMNWHTQPYLMTFLFPIDTGRVWTSGVGLLDTTSVSGPLVVQVKGGSFFQSYWFKRRVPGFEGAEEYNVWLVPEVGIASALIHVVDLMSPRQHLYQSWELLDWDFSQ